MSGRRRRQRWIERQQAALTSGQFVAWDASTGQSKGRIVSMHVGTVPGVQGGRLTATAGEAAARVQLYAKTGSGWEPTNVHIAQPVAHLTAVEALPKPNTTETTVTPGSFDEIRQKVQDAIEDRIEQQTGVDPSVYVYDIGLDWAVYDIGWRGDLQMVNYTIGQDGAVALTAPVAVCRVISYVPDTEAATDSTGSDPTDSDPAPVAGMVDPMCGPEADEVTETVRHEGRLLASLGTNSDGGRVFEVQIIAYGDSKNGRRYPEAVMRAAADMYNGAKAYDHHRTDAELNTGTVAGIVGHYENVHATENGLVGELHLLPSATHTAELLDRTLANQTAGMPALVGISHDVMASYKPIAVNGRQIREVTAIAAVNSADVVADPAAGGKAMRMVANTGVHPSTTDPKEINVTYKQLLALFRASEAAKRPALLQEHGQLIESFGFTTDEFAREVETTSPAPAGRTTETAPAATPVVHAKESVVAGMLIKHAVEAANLDARLNETITADLPDQFTEADLTAAVARAKRISEAAGLKPSIEAPATDGVKVRFDSLDKKKAALDAFFGQNWQEGYRSFKEAYLDVTGYRGTDVFGEDFNRRILQESAMTKPGEFYDSMRSTESVSSSTWSLILGDSITRHMVLEYNRASFQDWRKLVNIFPINDFRTQRVDRLGDYAVLPTVSQGTPYQPLATPSNEEATYAPTKRGGTEDLTIETIANDDIRVISRLPQRLGVAAAITVYKFVMDFFIAPITATYDSTATFAAGHGNTDTNALSDTNLSTGRVKMLKQTALSGQANFLPIVPRYLLAPPDLWQLANVLTKSAVAVPSGIAAASNVVNLNQDLETIIVPYWTATSTTAWFLAAEPSMTPGIELGFYQGKTDPDLFVQADPTVGSAFDADAVTYKIRHIYGGTVVDHRALYRGNT